MWHEAGMLQCFTETNEFGAPEHCLGPRSAKVAVASDGTWHVIFFMPGVCGPLGSWPAVHMQDPQTEKGL